ncbi:MAG TPA: type III pantothenate kinase [Candidatus Kapabacteria bacterium]|nr:type III pantothenate kinase [Candidatus Kapabacteria bacterium]
MTLCIDIGNTRTTFALVHNGAVIAHAHESSRHSAFKKVQHVVHMLIAGASPGAVSAAGIASVFPYLTALVTNVVKEEMKREPHIISAATAGMKTSYANPAAIGADRLCNAAAAFALAKGPAIVIDCGTAITIDCVSASGEFIGGAILAGYRTAAHALAGNTAQLPDIPFERPEKALGDSTEHCLQSGVILGTTFAIEGLVRKIVDEAYTISSPALIVTGGHHDIFSATTSMEVQPIPDLVLMGIEILTANAGR